VEYISIKTISQLRATIKEVGHDSIIIYVGLDVHKESIEVSVIEEYDEARHYGKLRNKISAIDNVIRRLQSKGPRELKFVVVS